jgi:hypothetical protein
VLGFLLVWSCELVRVATRLWVCLIPKKLAGMWLAALAQD